MTGNHVDLLLTFPERCRGEPLVINSVDVCRQNIASVCLKLINCVLELFLDLQVKQYVKFMYSNLQLYIVCRKFRTLTGFSIRTPSPKLTTDR